MHYFVVKNVSNNEQICSNVIVEIIDKWTETSELVDQMSKLYVNL